MTAPLTTQPAATSLCPHPHGKKAKRCRKCQIAHLNSDPVAKANHKAAMQRHYADPAVRAKAVATIRANTAKDMADPVKLEQRREKGRQQYRNVLSRPDVRAKAHSPEARKRAGATHSARDLADIPPRLRDEYRALVKSNNVNAAEARQIILDQYRRDIGRTAARTLADEARS